MGISFNLIAASGSLTILGAYSAGTTYSANDCVTESGSLYRSLSNGNIAHTPSTSPTFWEVDVTGGAVPANTDAGGTGATGASGTGATGSDGTGTSSSSGASATTSDGASATTSDGASATTAGASHNHAFTGTAPAQAFSPKFAGTGFATAGQTTTTTDVHTVVEDEYAGMLFCSATQAPCLISNSSAVTGAPVVLTMYGLAPSTDAGGYMILRAPTPAGVNAAESTHTHTAPAHTHTAPAHTHTAPAHTHTGAAHTHTGPSHTHTGPSHTHPITP